MGDQSKRRAPTGEQVSIEEAATMLGVPIKAVRQLVKKGVLEEARRENKRSFFHLKDLREAAQYLERKLDLGLVHHTALRALTASSRVERKLDLLLSFFGAHYQPLSTEELDVEAVHLKARFYQHGELPLLEASDVFEWAQTLLRIDQPYLDLMSAVTRDIEPWRPFLESADRLLLDMPEERVSLEPDMQAAYGVLEYARRALRQTAYMYCRFERGRKAADMTFPETARGNVNEILLAILYPLDGCRCAHL